MSGNDWTDLHKAWKPKVHIMGMHPIGALQPEDDDAEIWRINEAYRSDERLGKTPHTDRWFQLHQRWDFTRRQNRSEEDNWKDHWDWLRTEHGFPIYMQQEYDDIPNSVRFPLSEIFEHFGIIDGKEAGPQHERFFRNTLSYCIAFAIYAGFEEIGIYGWELSTKTERSYEKPSALFWLGVAKGMGVRIGLPPGSSLLGWGERLYAFEDVPAVNLMHMEMREWSAKSSVQSLERALSKYPDNEEFRDALLIAMGEQRAISNIMAELDDVQDPRGNFGEDTEEA